MVDFINATENFHPFNHEVEFTPFVLQPLLPLNSQMSYTPQKLEKLLNYYDEKVIEGLDNGNIYKVMVVIEPEIVSPKKLKIKN